MFTIRHIDCTVDNLYQAERVTFFDPRTPQQAMDNEAVPDVPGVLGALELRGAGDVFIVGLWGGVAYVMNDAGKTVTRYDLPSAPREAGSPADADRQPGEIIEDYALRSSVGSYRAAESKAQGDVVQETSTAPSCGSTAGKFVDTGGNDWTPACN